MSKISRTNNSISTRVYILKDVHTTNRLHLIDSLQVLTTAMSIKKNVYSTLNFLVLFLK